MSTLAAPIRTGPASLASVTWPDGWNSTSDARRGTVSLQSAAHGLPTAQDEGDVGVPVRRSNRDVSGGAADPFHCPGPASPARSPAVPVTVSFPARPISSTLRTGPLVSATLREPPPPPVAGTSGGRPS